MSLLDRIKSFISTREDDSTDIVIKRAQETICTINNSLSIANQSKEPSTRESELKKARDELVELKKLANKFPFLCNLHLQNLQAVEASIIAVEAETSLLPYNDAADSSVKDVPDKVQPEKSGQGRQRHSEREKQVILMCIQSCFRVVNESIEIARKSKNLETKLSRLRVARNSLKEARRQANQFSLTVDGFAEAEAEINRIDEAIKADTPTEIAVNLPKSVPPITRGFGVVQHSVLDRRQIAERIMR